MIRLIVRKFITFCISLFLVVTLTFCVMKIIPGDPFLQEHIVTEEILQSLRSYYGLNQPLIVQYGKYLKGILTGNLGPSLIYEGRTVNQIIQDGFPISATLGLEAILLSFSWGTFLGSIAALYKGKWQDRGAMIFAIIGISFPNFLLATLLQYCFSIQLNWLPVARWGSFAHTILPALALSALPTAFIARLTRSSLVEVLEQDYIKMALAKGLRSSRVILFHGLRNAILPVLSYLGTISANVLTGSFIIEKIFGIPGLGQWMILSISNRDYSVILGLTVFYSFLLISIIFVVNLLYSLVDPRIKNFQTQKATQ